MLGKLNDFQMVRLLLTETHGHLGCYADGEIYVVPVSYVYESDDKGERIYGYTIEGRKIAYMRKNPEVCIQVESIHTKAHWQSVIAWGRFEELTGTEADHAVRIITSRMHPFISSETTRPEHSMQLLSGQYDPGMKTVAYKIVVTRKTGRFERR